MERPYEHFLRRICGGVDFADPIHIEALRHGRHVDGFYILVRRKPPERVYRELPGGQDCHDEAHQDQMFRDIGGPLAVSAAVLADDSLLLIPLYGGYIVKMRRFPRVTLGLGDNVFLVPENEVTRELSRAGPGLHQRYAVFLKAIAGAKALQATAPTEELR